MPAKIAATISRLAVPIDELRPYAANPRRGRIDQIKDSLRFHGQYRPVVVRRPSGEILAGNHTFLAARELGWRELAATYVECDDDEAKRIMLVDNRANDLAERPALSARTVDGHRRADGRLRARAL